MLEVTLYLFLTTESNYNTKFIPQIYKDFIKWDYANNNKLIVHDALISILSRLFALCLYFPLNRVYIPKVAGYYKFVDCILSGFRKNELFLGSALDQFKVHCTKIKVFRHRFCSTCD